MNAKQVLQYHEKLKNDLANYLTLWQEIADYMVPRRNSITTQVTPGTKRMKAYDSTAIVANDDLGNFINKNLTSMAMQWFTLRVGRETEKEKLIDKEGEMWLEDCQERLFDALRASNFSSEIQELYSDWPSIGVGSIYIEEKDIKKKGFNGFNFYCLSPGTYCVEWGIDGMPRCLYREFKISAQAAFDRWGNDVGEKIKGYMERDPFRDCSFVHSVFPSQWFGGQHKTQMEFASYYIDVESKKKVEEGGYPEFPFAVVPWKKASGEKYATGLGAIALPDVRTLNEAVKKSLKTWDKAIDPPLVAFQNGLIGQIRTYAGGITWVNRDDALTELKSQGNLDYSQIKLEETRASIRRIFLNDKIQYVPSLDERGPQMTAYEVARRYEIAQGLLGPAFDNMVSYGLDQIVEIGFNIMYRAGGFKPRPDSILALAQSGNDRVNIKYEGPLARAQRMQEIQAISNTMQVIGPLREIHPEMDDNYDWDGIARYVPEVQGMPKKLILSEKERDEKRSDRAKALAEQQAQQAATVGADIAQKGAGAIKDLAPDQLSKAAEMMGKMGMARA